MAIATVTTGERMSVGRMTSPVLTASFFLFCCLGASFAQSSATATPDPQTSNDTKLVAAPVPAEEKQQFHEGIKDVHFDFDRADLRAEDRAVLASDAEWLKSHPDVLITLEGDADDRGDIVYNLALSGQRAIVTKDALVELGVSADRIAFATGWGKLYPICSESDESCWSQNRRTHLAPWPHSAENGQVASR
jgi:peptidoglycan-associated lipoprotein